MISKLWREIKKPLARLYYFVRAYNMGLSSRAFSHFELHRNAISLRNDGKVKLPYLETDIVIGCNLKCEQCSHLSPFRKGVVPADDVIRWFRLWSEKIVPKKLALLGGEPLLHPELPRILRETKSIWPQTVIELVTNGLLFSKVASDVLEALEETQIKVVISNHSSSESEQQTFQTAISRLHQSSVNYKIRNSNQKWRVQYNKTPDGTPVEFSGNPKTAWEICISKTCIALANNQLYKCSILAGILEGVSENALSREHWSSAFSYQPLTLDASHREIVDHLKCRQITACTICPDKKIMITPIQMLKRN